MLRSFGIAAGLIFCAGQSASAINIITNYNPAGSGAINPSFDNNATQLDAIFNDVEAYYEDIFEDAGHTLTINFWYTDLTSLLGLHNFVSADINNRESVANIMIDTNVGSGGALRSYFYDTTPEDNSEFTMSQTLWRDIGGTNQSDWYNFSNPIPDTFEVGFTGTATGGGAVGNIDMFSLVLHEVGHALGMSGGSPGTQAEAGTDNDYDFDPNFIFGANLAADTRDQASDFIGHLDGGNMLMFPSLGGAGTRKLPSHTDLMAMAAGNNYLTLDAPRREFYGGGNWNNNFNWTGSRDPDSNDDAFVRDSQGAGTVITASLSANGVARNLEVSEGANVDVNSYQLSISDDVTITGLDTDIFINPGGELQADRVFIQDQAEIEMNGGTLDANRVTIDAGTQLEGVSGGAMTIDVSTRLTNNGVIDVDADAVMTFISTGGNTWDLDGTSGDGQLFANDGDLIFDTGSLSDAFGGEITVGPGHFLRIDAAWAVESGAVLHLNGGSGAGQAAQMTGGTITFNGGTIDVLDVGGDGVSDGTVEFGSPVTVNNGTFTVGIDDTLNFLNVTTIDGGIIHLLNGASLNFNGPTGVNGGTFFTFSDVPSGGDVEFNGGTSWRGVTTINGIARQDGDAQVGGGPATINADVFDMDGNTGAGQDWFLSDDLTINADKIDTAGGYDGTIHINNGFATLTINTPSAWIMSGTLNITHGVNSTNTSIDGQDFILSGTANIDAWTGFDAKVNITGVINFLNAGNVLSIRGNSTADPNTINGGIISGNGTLSLGSADGLVGNGTIVPSSIALGLNARLLASGGQLFINSNAITNSTFARIGTADDTGTLFLNGTLDTSRVQSLELRGGFVTGDLVNNVGTTFGHGTITTDGFNNRGTLSASGGTLILATPEAFDPDLDGTSEAGVIEAINGSVQVNNDYAGVQTFDGTLTVGGGEEFRMLNDGIRNNGQMTLQGGTYVAPLFRQAENLTVENSISTLESDSLFESGSVTNINASLNLIGNTDIQAGATVSGSAELINITGSNLQLLDGAEIGVDLVNQGFMEVGDSPGSANIRARAQFTSSASYLEELGGSIFGQYDRLTLTEDIRLAGSLRVVLTDGHTPGIGDAYQIIDTSLGVIGAFDDVLLPNTPGVSLCVLYDPTSVYLLALLPGDLNGDGFVGIEDLNVVLGVWNQNVTAGVWGGGDTNGDGFVGIDDLNVVLGNWNNGTPPTTQADIPEPTVLSLLTIGLLGLSSGRPARQ